MEASGSLVRFRQYPGLTRQDAATLTQLAATAGHHVARSFERLIRSQNTATQQFHTQVLLETDAGAPVEILGARTLTRWAYGTGGGRHHHPAGHGPDT